MVTVTRHSLHGSATPGMADDAGVGAHHGATESAPAVYAIMLIAVMLARSGETWGLGKWWSTVPLVQRFAALK